MSLHNVSELSEQILFDFAVSYKRACKQIGKDVLSASPEEQKKAKANVMPCVRNYKTGLFEELSEEESWRLLKECAEKRDSLCAERRKEWESALDLFDPACAAEIRAYVGESYFGDVLCDIAMGKDGGVSVILDDNCAFSRKLVLDNAKTEGKIPKAFYESELVSLKAESGGGFTLTARAMEFYDDTEDDAEDEEMRFEERKLTVSFSSAHIEKKCYNAVRSFVFNPFDWYGKNVYMLVTMVSACSYIVRKYENCRELVNEKELPLIPLCRDIAKLDWVLADDEAAQAGFPHLSALAREYGAEDLIPLVKEFANAGEGTQRKIAKLASKLFTAEKEPFMRAVYENINDSQKEYPQKNPLTQEQIKAVESGLREEGFKGEYPLYSKRGVVKASSFEAGIDGKRHKVAGGDAVMFVYCTGGAGSGLVSFISGTRILEDGESPDAADLFSCLFKDKDRRICRVTSFDLESKIETNSKAAPDDAELTGLASVAAKRAGLKKLSKNEIMMTGGNTDSGSRHVLLSALANILPMLFLYLLVVMLISALGAGLGLLVSIIKWDLSQLAEVFETYWKHILIIPAIGIGCLMIYHVVKDFFRR